MDSPNFKGSPVLIKPQSNYLEQRIGEMEQDLLLLHQLQLVKQQQQQVNILNVHVPTGVGVLEAADGGCCCRVLEGADGSLGHRVHHPLPDLDKQGGHLGQQVPCELFENMEFYQFTIIK